MSRVRVDPAGRWIDAQPVRLGLGLAVPLGVVSLAYVLWWISDRLLYIGPLDRASFGWAVVVPVWLSVPVVAGFSWRWLTPRRTTLAVVAFGVIVSSAASFLFWQAVAHPACDFGAARLPIDLVLPSLLVGAVIGAGLAATGLLVAVLVRGGHPWRAAVFGAGGELVLVFVAILAATAVLLGPGCQRPPV